MTAEEAYRSYLGAVLTGDRREAFQLVDALRADGFDMRSLYLDVFQPTLREIGRLWQEDEINVAQEHLATAITQGAMARLYSDLFAAAPLGGPILLAACTDTERHEVGLRMICDLLELEGWDTIYLGATVPIESLVEIVRAREPDVVALSASIRPHLPQLRSMARAVREAMGEASPLIAVGGRPFIEDPGLVERVGADFTARDAGDLIEHLRERFA